MSEEQIINYIKRDIEETSKQIENGDLMFIEDNEKIRIAFLQSLLNLYKKVKKKNRSLLLKTATLEKQIKLMKSVNINDNFISKDKIKEAIENSVCDYDCLRENIEILLYGEEYFK